MTLVRRGSAWLICCLPFSGFMLTIWWSNHIQVVQAVAPAQREVTVVTYELPFAWQGQAEIAPSEVNAVAPPLEALDVAGDFKLFYVPTDAGNVIRILPVAGEQPAAERSLRLVWRLTPASSEPALPAGGGVTLTLWARLYSPPEGAQLSIREFSNDWYSSTVALEETAWTAYTVTRQISDESSEVQLSLDWQPSLASAWLELRDWRVTIQAAGATAAASASAGTPSAPSAPTVEPAATPLPDSGVASETATEQGATTPATPPAASSPITTTPGITYSLPFTWQGPAAISPNEVISVAPPLEGLQIVGDFQLFYVPGEAGNVIRILPATPGQPGRWLRLGWRLLPESTVALFPAGSVVTLSLWARLYSPPDGARLVIWELTDDWRTSTVPMREPGWSAYTVTRQIAAEATYVQLSVDWNPPPENAWLEIRDMQVTIRPPDETTLAVLSPTDTLTPTPAPPQPPAETPTPEATAVSLVPTPLPSPTMFIVTSTPTPVDIFAEATRLVMATDWARVLGPATPTPANLVTPTPTPTPIIITDTPTPENAATAAYVALYATAVAFTTGTPTPFPEGAVVLRATDAPLPPPTLTPTPTPFYIYLEELPPTAEPQPTPPFPQELVGKILFLATHLTNNPRLPNAFMMNPDGTGMALLLGRQFYDRAVIRDAFSPDMRFRVFVEGEGAAPSSYETKLQLFYTDAEYGADRHQLTYFGAGVAWAPVWSPIGETVALVSSESANDEIWVVQRNSWPGAQLTKNNWEWDHHPSFSPDGSQIVFSSNRVSGRRQLWIMDASGGNQRQLTNFTFEAFDPVWVKYPDS